MSAPARRRTPAHHYLWRFVAGHALDGKVRGDGSWLRRAAVVEPSRLTGRPTRWHKRAGAERTLIRLSVCAALYGLWRADLVTVAVLVCAGIPWAAVKAARVVRAARSARHRREVTGPIAEALSGFLAVPPAEVEPGLKVLPGFAEAEGGAQVAELVVPDGWPGTPDMRARVEQVLSSKLGLQLRFRWSLDRYPPMVAVDRAALPPDMVRLADVRELAESCGPTEVLLGVTAARTPLRGDLRQDDPHWILTAPSRRGKSNVLLLIIAQVLRRGGLVWAVDPKAVSLLSLVGLDRVRLSADSRDVADMWATVAEFRAEIERRMDALKEDPTASADWPRALLVIDELSQFSGQSDRLWMQLRTKADPATPPVWDDIAACAFMGAQFNCNMLLAGQDMTQKTLKGLRNQFGVRLLSGFVPAVYTYLVGLAPVPRSQKHRGRWLVYQGGELTWCQTVFAEPGEYRDWITEAQRGPGAPGSDLVRCEGTGTPVAPAVVVGLGAAADHLGMNAEAFKKARQRRAIPGEVIIDGRPQWRPAELAAWQVARPRAGRVAVQAGAEPGSSPS